MGKVSDFHPKNAYLLVLKISRTFGKNFVFLMLTEFFTQVGMMGDLVSVIQTPYYNLAGVDASERIEMGIISDIPSNCKSLIGLVTDMFPIFGKRKLYYVTSYCILGIVCDLALIFIPPSLVKASPIIPALLFLGFNLAPASSDLLFEAKNVELMQKNPHIKSDLLSFCWFCDVLGQLVPSILVGTFADYFDIRLIFVIYLPFIITPLPFLFKGGLIEDDAPNGHSGVDWYIVKSQWRLIIVSVLQAVISIGSIFIIYFFSSNTQLIYSIVTGLIIVFSSFYFLDLRTAKWFFFLFAYAALYINVQPILEYYYLAKESCAPDGPQFSYTVVTTGAAVLNNIVQVGAIFVFQIVFADWKFRSVFTLCISVRIASNFFDFMIINNWASAIGLPEELVYLFGFGAMGSMAFRVHLYVNSYLNAKLCPKNFEATMYSLLTASGYVGVSIANFMGVSITEFFNIQTIEDEEKGLVCNFDNLNIVLLLSHVIVPLLSIPLVYIFIPGIRLNELLLFDNVKENTHTKQITTEKKEDLNNNHDITVV